MIRITIGRDAEGRIVSFAVVGHANSAKRGKDIVCAGVSTVSVGTVNAIETLTGIVLPATMKDGWLSSEIPTHSDPEVDGKLQLLLESMVVMLETIASSYGKFVDIVDPAN